MMDIDYFKIYNDTYGHLAGDECLQSVANILRSCMRRPTDMVARYGGEEFVCILPETSLEGAINIAECFKAKLKAQAILHENSSVAKYVTISTGIAITTPENGNKPETLISMADKKLYQAKEEGRNKLVF